MTDSFRMKRSKSSLPLWLGLFLLLTGFSHACVAQTEPKWCGAWQPLELNASAWEIVYDGYGQVSFDGGIRLKPMAAEDASSTHASLVLLKAPPQTKRYAVRIRYTNVQQLRLASPNPWETFWLFFDYRFENGFKSTNYLIHKSNGMELGRAWNELDQSFVATASSPQAAVGTSYEMTLVRESGSVRAFIDGNLALATDQTQSLERSGGRIGLYTEDAEILVTSVELCVAR